MTPRRVMGGLVLLITTAVISAVSGCGGGPGPVDVTPTAPDEHVAAQCRELVDALPDAVADDLDAREIEPPDALAAAWGDPAVVLRCGVERPSALRPTSACAEVNGVGWLTTQDGREVSGEESVRGTLTFTTIGRVAYVEVRVPELSDHAPVDPLAALAGPIKATIPTSHPCR